MKIRLLSTSRAENMDSVDQKKDLKDSKGMEKKRNAVTQNGVLP